MELNIKVFMLMDAILLFLMSTLIIFHGKIVELF